MFFLLSLLIVSPCLADDAPVQNDPPTVETGDSSQLGLVTTASLLLGNSNEREITGRALSGVGIGAGYEVADDIEVLFNYNFMAYQQGYHSRFSASSASGLQALTVSEHQTDVNLGVGVGLLSLIGQDDLAELLDLKPVFGLRYTALNNPYFATHSGAISAGLQIVVQPIDLVHVNASASYGMAVLQSKETLSIMGVPTGFADFTLGAGVDLAPLSVDLNWSAHEIVFENTVRLQNMAALTVSVAL